MIFTPRLAGNLRHLNLSPVRTLPPTPGADWHSHLASANGALAIRGTRSLLWSLASCQSYE